MEEGEGEEEREEEGERHGSWMNGGGSLLEMGSFVLCKKMARSKLFSPMANERDREGRVAF